MQMPQDLHQLSVTTSFLVGLTWIACLRLSFEAIHKTFPAPLTVCALLIRTQVLLENLPLRLLSLQRCFLEFSAVLAGSAVYPCCDLFDNI